MDRLLCLAPRQYQKIPLGEGAAISSLGSHILRVIWQTNDLVEKVFACVPMDGDNQLMTGEE